MRQLHGDFAKNALKALREYMVEFGGEAGFHGEFSAQLLLLAARDHASGRSPHLGCTIREFFNALVDPSLILTPAVLGAKLAFTQFVKTQAKEIGNWHIRWAMHFGYALSTSHANNGFTSL